MATAIHHGPPGSYKSFTLVQRFAIPALKQGRAVVTNIRGFDSVERVIDQFSNDEFSPDARIIWVDTTTQAGRTKMAKWFHWVPFGAMIIIDEVQQVYPDRRDFKLESLDHYQPEPNEIVEEIGLPEGRPEDVFTAYDKQRHYNWDIYLSTPNIAKVKKEIREVSEWAYRHRDLSGLLPWYQHRWTEHQHDPETSGKAASHRVGTPTQYQADARVFACYASTATGQHVKSKAGRTILQDRKLLSMLVLIVACILFAIYSATKYQTQRQAILAPDAATQKAVNPAKPEPVHHAQPSVPVSLNAQPAIPALDRLKYIDRDTAQTWNRDGLKPDELNRLPINCIVNHYTAKCPAPYDPNLLRVVTNYTCAPLKAQMFCTLIFFIHQPPKPVPHDDKVQVVAKAMPF